MGFQRNLAIWGFVFLAFLVGVHEIIGAIPLKYNQNVWLIVTQIFIAAMSTLLAVMLIMRGTLPVIPAPPAAGAGNGADEKSDVVDSSSDHESSVGDSSTV